MKIMEERDTNLELSEKKMANIDEEILYCDFFAGTYCALMNKYKIKYSLTKEEQADYFFESMMIMCIQIVLCLLTWSYILQEDTTITADYHNDFKLNLAMFFTNLVLHFSCISTIRNGINMVKFAVYHGDEFQNPNIAYFLGVMVIFSNVFSAFTNSYMTMTRSTIMDVISKFVGFKVLI
jgi:hypothetical protein